MEHISHINGLTVEIIDKKRVVKYQEQECPRINRDERFCEANTSYNGDILDSWETYKTPLGIIERHYWARGAGLERSGVDWRLIPAEEITAAQKRFEEASIEISRARKALEMVVA